MAQDIEVRIHSQPPIEGLNERAVKEIYARLVEHVAGQGADILKFMVPHDKGAMAAHAGHTPPIDEDGKLTAHIGIPPIYQPGGSPGSMLYPIYVDKGTGIYGENRSPIYAYRANYMKLPPKGSFPIYQYSVKGQRPQHYMVKTYALLAASLRINAEIFKAELKARLTQ